MGVFPGTGAGITGSHIQTHGRVVCSNPSTNPLHRHQALIRSPLVIAGGLAGVPRPSGTVWREPSQPSPRGPCDVGPGRGPGTRALIPARPALDSLQGGETDRLGDNEFIEVSAVLSYRALCHQRSSWQRRPRFSKTWLVQRQKGIGLSLGVTHWITLDTEGRGDSRTALTVSVTLCWFPVPESVMLNVSHWLAPSVKYP